MSKGLQAHQEREKQVQSFGKQLARRAKSKCELCGEAASLSIFEVPPVDEPDIDHCVMICETCQTQIEKPKQIDPNHWFCLHEIIWSEIPAVQVLAYRMLQKIQDQGWAQDLMDQAYLADEILAWAKNDGTKGSGVETFDSNGTRLLEGDSVMLIKDLPVKGTSFTAKRGTLVKGIHLTDDPAHIEGKVNKMQIVLKTEFLKKAN